MRQWAIFLWIFPLLFGQSRPVVALSLPPHVSSLQNSPWIGSTHAEAEHSPHPLTELVQAADLMVRGRVRQIDSFWTPDRTAIESAVTIVLEQQQADNPLNRITLRTLGGYLPAEGLGMVSAHAATFALGEEVLLLLQESATGWQLVDGAAGKFLIDGDRVINEELALVQPLHRLLPTVVGWVSSKKIRDRLAVGWSQWEGQASGRLATSGQGSPRRWATPHATAPFYIHINTEQANGAAGTRSDFRNAIIAAAASWSGVASADFALAYMGETATSQTGYNGVNEVLFMSKGRKERAAAAQAWYTADQTIIEADIWINDDYPWDATGNPAANTVDLQSALLHEFGHWLILGHFPEREAVMFARLASGTLKRELQLPDVAGISAIYPR